MDQETVKGFESFLNKKLTNRKTIEEYISSIRQLPKDILNKTDEEIIEFLNNRIIKYPTRLYYKFSFKYFLDFIGKIHLYSKLSSPEKVSRKIKKKFLSFKKIKKLVDNCNDEELSLIMRIQYSSAARISEILETTLDDVDYDGDKATITMRIKKKKGRVDIITRYLDELTTQKLKEFIDKRKPTNKIFSLNYYQVWKKEVRLSEKILGLRITPHWFRGSRAVDILRTLKNPIEVKEQLGHSDIRSTEVYLQESGIGSKEIIEKVKPSW